MQPLLSADKVAGTVLNTVHVLTHLIPQPLQEVGTMITPLICKIRNNTRDIGDLCLDHITEE